MAARDPRHGLVLATKIFSEFKDRSQSLDIVRHTVLANRPNESVWKEAGRINTEAVWRSVLRDFLIPQHTEWLETVKNNFGEHEPTQTTLMKLAKQIRDFGRAVTLLRDASPVAGKHQNGINMVIAPNCTAIVDLLYDASFKKVCGELREGEIVAKVVPILEETTWILEETLRDFPQPTIDSTYWLDLEQSCSGSDISSDEAGNSVSGRHSVMHPTLPGMSELTDSKKTDASFGGAWSSRDYGARGLASSLAEYLASTMVNEADQTATVGMLQDDTDRDSDRSYMSRSPSVFSEKSAGSTDTEYTSAKIAARCDRIENAL